MVIIHETHDKYIEKYRKILDFNCVEYQVLNCQQDSFWEQIKKARLFIMHLQLDSASLIRQRNLISVIDRVLHIPCFPDWQTAWHYDDKIAETYLLQSKGYPLAKSWIFWDRESALVWAKQAEYPLVFKLKNGASSINVIKVTSHNHAIRLINLMFGSGIVNNRVPGSGLLSIYKRDPVNLVRAQTQYWLDKYGLKFNKHGNPSRERGYVLFQEFIPNNAFDYRVNIYGDATFAFKRMNREGDFRSSGSGKYDLSPSYIPPGVISIAQEIQREMGFQMMAYDFLINARGEPVIIEIGCQSAGIAVAQCPGYWDWELKWHEGKILPQYKILQFLLSDLDLLPPD